MIEALKYPLCAKDLCAAYEQIFGCDVSDILHSDVLQDLVDLLNEAYEKGWRDGKLGIDNLHG